MELSLISNSVVNQIDLIHQLHGSQLAMLDSKVLGFSNQFLSLKKIE